MFYTLLVSFILLFTNVSAGKNDDGNKRERDNQGLITTFSIGDKAPLGHYFYIISSIAIDSTSTNVNIDSISKKLMLNSAFYTPQTESVFRFDKDPYELYYKIILGHTNQCAVDVTSDILQPYQSLSVNTINYGNGQGFYLKHVSNGRYKIYHCTGKAVTISFNGINGGANAVLTDDIDTEENEWIFVDSETFKIYKPQQ